MRTDGRAHFEVTDGSGIDPRPTPPELCIEEEMEEEDELLGLRERVEESLEMGSRV